MKASSAIVFGIVASLTPGMAAAKVSCLSVYEALKARSAIKVSVAPEKIKGMDVVHLQERSSQSGPKITDAKVATGAGATLVELTVELPGGRRFNLLGPGTAKTIQENYVKALATDSHPGNTFFKPAANAPFGMMANRLTGVEVRPGVIEASILGVKVQMPLNHGLGQGQVPHHLHGTLFDKPATRVDQSDPTKAFVSHYFAPGFDKGFWAGRPAITVKQGVVDGRFEFMMKTENKGDAPIPVGAGAHPYFLAPSGDPSAVKLVIPARKLVEIDNYDNVLPTGRILEIEKGSHYDFNNSEGVPLNGRYFDNLFVDLILDKDGYAYAEFIDTRAKLRVRLTALTKNVIGIQLYAPKPETNPKLGVFAALELVTNLPDPREALWGETNTGMQLVKPGESHSYGYKIETFPLE